MVIYNTSTFITRLKISVVSIYVHYWARLGYMMTFLADRMVVLGDPPLEYCVTRQLQ